MMPPRTTHDGGEFLHIPFRLFDASYPTNPTTNTQDRHRMLPPELQSQLLSLAETLPLIVANTATPDGIVKIILDLIQELKTTLGDDSLRTVQAAEVKAVMRAVAYRRED
jgi:hypothetical protein